MEEVVRHLCGVIKNLEKEIISSQEGEYQMKQNLYGRHWNNANLLGCGLSKHSGQFED